MKLLLDENIPSSMKKMLENEGYGVEHVNNKLKGKSDKEVFNHAKENKQCIVTYDYDFNELRKEPHFGIIKIDKIVDNHQQRLLRILEDYKHEGIEDIYIYLGKNKIYKEIKKYTKKTHKFKQFHRIPLEIV